jgi:hypothetical protein
MPYGRDRASFERTWPHSLGLRVHANTAMGSPPLGTERFVFCLGWSAIRQTGSSQCDNYLHCPRLTSKGTLEAQRDRRL